MAIKVSEILLVASPYDAFIMEEDGSLASRIVNEYSGLNLSQPPRVTRVTTADEALARLAGKPFDLVITTPHIEGMDAFSLGRAVKRERPGLPVILLAHSLRGIHPPQASRDDSGIDRVFVWSGNSDLLLALVKNVEDQLNVADDTAKAQVRVLILVEDSPVYYSSFLPLIYKEVVRQTQAVLGVGLNEEHRLMRMRTRPKILLATSFDEALRIYRRHRPYVLGIISDTRIPRGGRMAEDAGYALLRGIRDEVPDLPLLLLSSEPGNRHRAAQVPALFLDKNSPDLLHELRRFFLNDLGFGPFVFRTPEGEEIERADDLRSLQAVLPRIPDDAIWYHARRNHFSKWIMCRSEIALASKFREVPASAFATAEDLRRYVIASIREMRRWQQKGIVAQFRADSYDAEIMEFVKIGSGSLGGKARGLAFMAALLQQNPNLFEKHAGIPIRIPKTLVICTDGFEAFVQANDLRRYAYDEVSDAVVRAHFLRGRVPEWIIDDLRAFLAQVQHPLSVRSSSLLEDAQFQPYAGLYETVMIPNNHLRFETRLEQLLSAIQCVWASTYYQGPKAFARSTANKPQEEAMAVIVQELAGETYGDHFYPALSGVAQSHNFYPVGPMHSEEGVGHIALGLGRTVVEGEKTLRFSPRHPRVLPQHSTVESTLKHCQRHFYALRIRGNPDALDFTRFGNLERRAVDDAEDEAPVRVLASTYIPDEHRIRDTTAMSGARVLTFAAILKYDLFALPQLLADLLALSRKGLGCPVEMEFSVNLNAADPSRSEFCLLQIRPMVGCTDRFEVCIAPEDRTRAFCLSGRALGNGRHTDIADIVYVKPDDFQPSATVQMAEEIGRINDLLMAEQRPYLLVGPGRWGSSDRWLGIPVKWPQICGVGAVVEVCDEKLPADPSQGSHFFQNITSLGIPYATVDGGPADFVDWQWLAALPAATETVFIRHVRLDRPLLVKVDGRAAACAMLKPRSEGPGADACAASG